MSNLRGRQRRAAAVFIDGDTGEPQVEPAREIEQHIYEITREDEDGLPSKNSNIYRDHPHLPRTRPTVRNDGSGGLTTTFVPSMRNAPYAHRDVATSVNNVSVNSVEFDRGTIDEMMNEVEAQQGNETWSINAETPANPLQILRENLDGYGENFQQSAFFNYFSFTMTPHDLRTFRVRDYVQQSPDNQQAITLVTEDHIRDGVFQHTADSCSIVDAIANALYQENGYAWSFPAMGVLVFPYETFQVGSNHQSESNNSFVNLFAHFNNDNYQSSFGTRTDLIDLTNGIEETKHQLGMYLVSIFHDLARRYYSIDFGNTKFKIKLCFISTGDGWTQFFNEPSYAKQHQYISRDLWMKSAGISINNDDNLCKLYAICISYLHSTWKDELDSKQLSKKIYRMRQLRGHTQYHNLVKKTINRQRALAFGVDIDRLLHENNQLTYDDTVSICKTLDVNLTVYTVGKNGLIWVNGLDVNEPPVNLPSDETLLDDEDQSLSSLDERTTIRIFMTLFDDGVMHYDSLIKTGIRTSSRQICVQCNKVVKDKRDHRCTKRRCGSCKKTFSSNIEYMHHISPDNQDGTPKQWHTCDVCKLRFRDTCFVIHTEKCEDPSRVRCTECHKIYDKKGKYAQTDEEHSSLYCVTDRPEPGFINCPTCGCVKPNPHVCFMTRITEDKEFDEEKTNVCIYDIESTLHKCTDEDQSSIRGHLDEDSIIHTPVWVNYVFLPTFYREFSDNYNACTSDEERSSIQESLLELLPDPLGVSFDEFVEEVVLKYGNTVFIAHNGGGYDHWLVMQKLIELNKPPYKVAGHGNKILFMQIDVVQEPIEDSSDINDDDGENTCKRKKVSHRSLFVDSLNFIRGPLKTLPKTVGLTASIRERVVFKDLFPYLALTPEAYSTPGYYTEPPPKHLFPKDVSQEEYDSYCLRFTETNPYDLVVEMKKYCARDVVVLAMSFMVFCFTVKKTLNIHPLSASTMPGLTLKAYRMHFMPEESIQLLTEKEYNDIRQAMYGGRVVVNGTHFIAPQARQLVKDYHKEKLKEAVHFEKNHFERGYSNTYEYENLTDEAKEIILDDERYADFVDNVHKHIGNPKYDNILFNPFLRHMDFNSLYPFVQNMCNMPRGKLKLYDFCKYSMSGKPDFGKPYTDEYFSPLWDQKDGVATVFIYPPNITNQRALGFIPKRMMRGDSQKLVFPLFPTWTTLTISSIRHALLLGYTITHVRKCYVSEHSDKTMFGNFMGNILKLKLKASKPPKEEDIERVLQECISTNIPVSEEELRAPYNPGERATAKTTANSFWGKFAQSVKVATENLDPVQFSVLWKRHIRKDISIKYFEPVTQQYMHVQYEEQLHVDPPNKFSSRPLRLHAHHLQNTSALIASSVLATARSCLTDGIVSIPTSPTDPGGIGAHYTPSGPKQSCSWTIYTDTDSFAYQQYHLMDSSHPKGYRIVPEMSRTQRLSTIANQTCSIHNIPSLREGDAIGDLLPENVEQTKDGKLFKILAFVVVGAKMYAKLVVQVDEYGRVVENGEVHCEFAGKGISFKKIKNIIFEDGKVIPTSDLDVFSLYSYLISHNTSVNIETGNMFLKKQRSFYEHYDIETPHQKKIDMLWEGEAGDVPLETGCVVTTNVTKKISYKPHAQKKDLIQSQYQPIGFDFNICFHHAKDLLGPRFKAIDAINPESDSCRIILEMLEERVGTIETNMLPPELHTCTT